MSGSFPSTWMLSFSFSSTSFTHTGTLNNEHTYRACFSLFIPDSESWTNTWRCLFMQEQRPQPPLFKSRIIQAPLFCAILRHCCISFLPAIFIWWMEHTSIEILEFHTRSHYEKCVKPAVFITSIMFSHVFHLLVCKHDNTKTTEQISMRLGQGMGLGPE